METQNQRVRRYSRRSFGRLIGAAAAAATLSPALIACRTPSNGKAADGAAAAPANRPVSGGTVTVGMNRDIANLDPMKFQEPYSESAVSNMTDALVRFDHQLRPVAGLATSWEVSPDGTQYVLHLRSGVTFQDGTVFNADAVKFNLQRHIQSKDSVHHSDVADVQAVDAIDGQTLRLTLGHPSAPFLSKLRLGAGYMLSPAAIQKLGDKLQTDFTGAGTGPYKFKQWSQGDHVTLARNPDYWERDANGIQLPYADTLVLRPIEDETVRLQSLRSGEIDLLPFWGAPPAKDIAGLKTDPSINYREEPGFTFPFLGCEVEHPPFDRKEVRQALAYALDRAQIAKTVYFDEFAPNDTVMPSTMPGADASYHPYLKQDVARAKQLLAQAGQSKISLTLQFPSGSPQVQSLGELIKDQAAAAGFDMQIQTAELGVVIGNGNKGTYQATLLNWTGGSAAGAADPDDEVYALFYTKAGFNISHYSNPALDQLLDKGRQTVDLPARIPIYQQAVRILTDDVPFIVLGNPLVNTTSSKKIQNAPLGSQPVAGFSRVWKAS